MNTVQITTEPFGVYAIYVNRRVVGNIVEVEGRFHVRTNALVLGWYATRLEAGEAVRRFYARTRLQREHVQAQIKVAQIEAKLRRTEPVDAYASDGASDGPYTQSPSERW